MRFFKHMTLFSVPIKQLLKRYFTYFMVMNLIMTNVAQAFGPSLCVEMMHDEIPQGNGTSVPSMRFMVGRKDVSTGHYSSYDFLLDKDLDELYDPRWRIADSTFTLEDGRDVEARYHYLGEGLVECALVGMGHESVFVFDLQGNLQIRKLDEGTSYKMNPLGSTTLVGGDHKAAKVTFGEGTSLMQGNLAAAKVSIKGALTNQGVLTTHKMHVREEGSFINKGSVNEGGQGFSLKNNGLIENTAQGTVAVGTMTVSGTGKTENKGVWYAASLTISAGSFLNSGALTTDQLNVTGSFINKKTFSTHGIEVSEAAQFTNQGTVGGRGKGVLLKNQGQVTNAQEGHMLPGHLTLKGSGTCLNEGTWHNTHLMCQEGTLLNHATLSAGRIDVASTVTNKGHLTSGKVHIQEKGTFTSDAKVTDKDGAFHLHCDGTFTGTQTSSLITSGNATVSGVGKIKNLGSWQGRGALIFEVGHGTSDTKFLNDGRITFERIEGVLHDLTNAGSMNGSWQLCTHYFANVGHMTGSGTLSNTELFTNFGIFDEGNIDLRIEKEGVNGLTLHVKSLGGQGHFSNYSEVHTDALSISRFHNRNDQGRKGSLVSSHLVVGQGTTFVIDGGTQVSGESMRVEEGGSFSLENHGRFNFKRVSLQGRIDNKGVMEGETLFWQGTVFHHLEGGSLIYDTGDLYGTVINDGLLKWLGGRLAIFQLENKGSVHFEGVDGLDVHHLINEGASNIGPKSLIHLLKTKNARLRHVVNKDKSGLRLEDDQNTTLDAVENRGKFESERSQSLHFKTLENHQDVSVTGGSGTHETLTNQGSFFIGEAAHHTFHHLVNKGHFQGTNVSHTLVKRLENFAAFLISGGKDLHFEKTFLEDGEWCVEKIEKYAEKPTLRLGKVYHKKGLTSFKNVASTTIDYLDQYGGSLIFQDLEKLFLSHMGKIGGDVTFQRVDSNKLGTFHHHQGTATFRDSEHHAFDVFENKSDLIFIHNNLVHAHLFDQQGTTEVSFNNGYATNQNHGLFCVQTMNASPDSTFLMSGGVFSVLGCLSVQAQAQISFVDLRQFYGRAVANTQGAITLKGSKKIHLHEFHQKGGRATFADNEGIVLAYLRNNKGEGQVQGSVLFNRNSHAFIGRTSQDSPEGGVHNEGALHIQNGDKTRIGKGWSRGVLLVENEKELSADTLTLDQEATFDQTPGAVLEGITNKGTLAFKGLHGARVKALKNEGLFEGSHTNMIDVDYFENRGQKAIFSHIHNLVSKHLELNAPTFLENVKAWRLDVLNIGSDAFFSLKEGEGFHIGFAEFCGKTILENVQDLRLHHGDVGSDVGHLSLKACAGSLNELSNHTTTVFPSTPIPIA